MSDDNNSDSDYNVEEYIKPKRVRSAINDDSADLLGNFDDQKRREIFDGTYREECGSSDIEEISSSGDDSGNDSDSGSVVSQTSQLDGYYNPNDSDKACDKNGHLTKNQLNALLRGSSKTNRFVLYVTNLNFESTKEDISNHFSSVGAVKSIRIPNKRRGGYAFVEMADIDSFQRGFQLHNTELQGRQIKIQISEAGKKKSANKKNIIKQKNRKLAEMRNEYKMFTKSGKFYDKDLKREKAEELRTRKMWRKKPLKE